MTHKFLPSASVNYSLPFRIEESSPSHNKATVTKQGDGMFRVEWDNGLEFNTPEANVYNCFEKGIWKLCKDVTYELPLGEFFKFETKQGTCVCTYTKQAYGNPVISWAEQSTTRYTEKDCRDNIARGEWTVIPTTCTPEQSSENAFKALEDVVRNHKQLNMENGSKVVFSTDDEGAWESSNNASDTLLDTIKAFTQDGLFHVALSEGIYKVYCYNAEYSVTSDEQLVQVMKALEILEGCLGD